MLVNAVVAGGMAALAGVEAGDHISHIGSHALGSLRELALALREAGSHASIEMRFVRGEEQRAAIVAVQPCARESLPGQEILYEQIDRPGARLRRITTRPSDREARGAILFVQGIACESVDYAGLSEEPIAQLVHGWAQAGYVTMRVDKRGVGDSEGPSCALGDFDTELADHRAALDALATDPRFGGLPLYLFGHSIGGMVAPILACDHKLAGVMVYGTSTRNWLECVLASTRRQLAMRDTDPADLERVLSGLRERVAREGLNGRSAAYHRQLDALDLAACWKRVVDTAVLVLCGEHDWVLSQAEQMEIADHVPGTECLELAGLDHMLGWHASREESLQAYGQGVFREEILSGTLEWLARCALQWQP
jgi:hypothetical protein